MRIASHRRSLFCVALLSAGATHAAETGFYVTATGGVADYDVGPSDDVLVPFNVPGLGVIHVNAPSQSVDVHNDGVTWSAVLGYRIHENVAAEIGFVDLAHADMVEEFAYRGVLVTQPAHLSVSGLAASVLGIFPVGKGFEPYVRIGALFADLEVASSTPLESTRVTLDSNEWLAGVGVQWSFADRWALRLEYQRVGTMKRNSAGGDLDLNHVALGASFAL